jgi:hypothetical protein
MIPILKRVDIEAASFEEYVVARDQPGANCRGKKIEQSENWERRQANSCKPVRSSKQKRVPTNVQDACANNFWSKPFLQIKAFEGTWRETINSVNRERYLAKKKATETREIDVNAGFTHSYRLSQKDKVNGPINIYDPTNEDLLLIYVVDINVPTVKIQAERIWTAILMSLYVRCDEFFSTKKRRAGKAKL